MKHTVKAPKELLPLFEQAEIQMANLFGKVNHYPEKGAIEIGNERYLLVRAASLSYDFFDSLVSVYLDKGLERSMEFARTFLFDFAHAMGKKDAEFYKQQMVLKTPLDTLSAGPVHFAYTGWAFVDISLESHLSADQDYFLLYDHIYSFESDSWLRLGKKAEIPICIMNAGYSSGWCEASFNMPLVAVEIMCKAQGDDCCRFIMAPPEKINGHIKKHLSSFAGLLNKKLNYSVHNFYEIEKYQKKIREFDQKLKENEEKFRIISAYAKEGIILMDSVGTVVFWNQAAAKLFGYSADDVLGKKLSDIIVPAKFKSEYEAALPYLFQSGVDMILDKKLTLEALTKNCEIIPIELSVSSVQISGLWHAIAVMHDIKERRSNENRMLRERAAINATKEGIIITDAQANILDVNPAFTAITGYDQKDVLGQNMSMLYADKEDKEIYFSIWHDVLVKGSWEGELWNHRKNGEKYAKKLSINSIQNSMGETDQYVVVFSDITARKEAIAKIVHQARIDPLTHVLNRASFIETLDEAIDVSNRYEQKMAMMFIDVDFFKAVNDKFGHIVGDKLLQQLAGRLLKCIRNSDILARLGGDEFAALLYDIKDIDSVTRIAKKICKEIERPFTVLNHKILVGVSVGIAIYPTDAEDSHQLIIRSDEAMYRIKNSTRNGYDFWGVV